MSMVSDRSMKKLSGIRKACFPSPDSVYFCPPKKTLLGCTTVATHLRAAIGKFYYYIKIQFNFCDLWRKSTDFSQDPQLLRRYFKVIPVCTGKTKLNAEKAVFKRETSFYVRQTFKSIILP